MKKQFDRAYNGKIMVTPKNIIKMNYFDLLKRDYRGKAYAEIEHIVLGLASFIRGAIYLIFLPAYLLFILIKAKKAAKSSISKGRNYFMGNENNGFNYPK